ncbi:MAG: hypothetical protein QM772_15545 [Ottowia sp.]|uniref:hypothetical protein n=1 Tax=Ottowia sp. TaxID=1898956 RepID=UPI0039E2B0D8
MKSDSSARPASAGSYGIDRNRKMQRPARPGETKRRLDLHLVLRGINFHLTPFHHSTLPQRGHLNDNLPKTIYKSKSTQEEQRRTSTYSSSSSIHRATNGEINQKITSTTT